MAFLACFFNDPHSFCSGDEADSSDILFSFGPISLLTSFVDKLVFTIRII